MRGDSRISCSKAAISIDKLYDEWRRRNPPSDDWLAIRASLEGMAAGDVGEDFAVFATTFRI